MNAVIPAPVSLPLLLFGALACLGAAARAQRRHHLGSLVHDRATSNQASGRRRLRLELHGSTRALVVGLLLASILGFLGRWGYSRGPPSWNTRRELVENP